MESWKVFLNVPSNGEYSAWEEGIVERRGERRRRIFDEMSRKSSSLLYNLIKKNMFIIKKKGDNIIRAIFDTQESRRDSDLQRSLV